MLTSISLASTNIWICHHFDVIIIDYRINFNPDNLFVDVLLTSVSLVISQLYFFGIVVMTSILGGCFHLAFVFRFFAISSMVSRPTTHPAVDPGHKSVTRLNSCSRREMYVRATQMVCICQQNMGSSFLDPLSFCEIYFRQIGLFFCICIFTS